jgi:hypothetical protein
MITLGFPQTVGVSNDCEVHGKMIEFGGGEDRTKKRILG